MSRKIGGRLAASALALASVTAAGLLSASSAHAVAGFTLHADNGWCLDSDAVGQVHLHSCGPNDNPYQHWYYGYSANGAWQVVNAATGRCLDDNAAGSVSTSICEPSDDPFQHWYVSSNSHGTTFLNQGVWDDTPGFSAYLKSAGSTVAMTYPGVSAPTGWRGGA